MLLTLTSLPTELERELFHSVLVDSHEYLVTGAAISLAFGPNQLGSRAYVREQELYKITAKAHGDWQVINDEEWLELTLRHEKSVVW